MKLRIRDTKTSLLYDENAIKALNNRPAKLFSIKNEKSKGYSLSDCSNSIPDSSSARVCYASSFTRFCDVTFVTVQELRSTSSLKRGAESCEFHNSLQPLDLSLKFLSRYHKPNRCKEALNLSRDLTAPTRDNSEEDRDSDSVAEVGVLTFERNFSNKNLYDMLSSRRHRSDETFADREHFNGSGGKSSYPHSAEGWLDARSSPDRDDSGNLEVVIDQVKDTNSIASEQSMRDEEEPVGQDVAFNYSTKTQTAKKIDSENLDSKLLKAKRARVENIVTNIKDKPQKQIASEANLDASSCDSETSTSQQLRKRRMGEKIRELQLEIESLQNECENEVYDESKENYDVDDNGTTTNKDCSMNHKRARYDDTEDRKETANIGDNRFYRGSINVMFPQNGNRPNSDLVAQTMAFQMLFRSIKRELVTVVEKVAERSAKRILEELHTGGKMENNQIFGKSDLKNDEEDRLKKQTDLDSMELIGSKKSHHTSRFVIDDKTENVHTSNQSQLCFGDVQVRKNQMVNDGRNTQQAKSRREHNVWENTSPMSGTSSQSPDNIRSENSEQEFQTQALSLVKKKSSSPLLASSSTPLGERPFVIRDGKERTTSLPTSPTKDVENFVKDLSKSSHLADSGLNPSRTSPDTSTKSKVLHPPFLSDANFYSSAASAFRLPFRNDALSSPPFRRDSYSAANLMKSSPFFPPSIYPSTAAPSPSVFPFSTGQLPFPLFQNFQQRSLASAIADYSRFNREGFEHGASRPVSTRTSTRESPRTSGLSRSHHGHKPDPLDYRSAPTEVSPYSAASIQEGLTPQHLKKAKLMFFYTRYPSANTLKTYFADVKFSRATTSQLIKWFSNFREFYYIQMEKFARQALSDGITDISQLKVTRDCELFRVLNLHYNKSNDFRVPKDFFTATLRSLQEFFLAIQKGKDHDPSWKKVIYKIICKLDQDIPELFKLPNVLERLDEITN